MMNEETPTIKKTQTKTLATVQRKTLKYLRDFIADNGCAPTLRDIARYIGVKSPSTAHFHLSRLEDKGFIRRQADGLVEIIENLNVTEITSSAPRLPLLGYIAAGSPIEAIENNDVEIDVPQHFLETVGEKYCLQVIGESMIDAHIMDGDIIVVRKQDTADDGKIVVAVLEDGTATLKTLKRHKGGKVMLMAHNPAFKPISVDKVDIRGTMIGLIREM